MERVAYLVMYDGLAFNGFSGGKGSVEHILASVLSRLNGSPIKLDKASRTDPGVSALMNVIAVNLRRELPVGLINSKLPPQVRIWGAARVPSDFNPRKAIQRTYIYFSPMQGEDVDLMRRAASLFVGHHDLRNYMLSDGSPTVVHMHEISVDAVGGFIMVRFKGRGFRNKMLRKIMHALLMVGRRELSVDYVAKTVDTEERLPMPPHSPYGLALEEVRYEEQPSFTINRGALSFFSKYMRRRLLETSALVALYGRLLEDAVNSYSP